MPDRAKLLEMHDESVRLVTKARERQEELQKEHGVEEWRESAKAEDVQKVDELYAEAERLDKQVRPGLERIRAEKAADSILEREELMRRSKGRVPVGTGSSHGERSDLLEHVVYKSRHDDPESKTFNPSDVDVGGSVGVFKAREEAEYSQVFRKLLTKGRESLTDEERELEVRKSLSVGLDAEGGFITASEVFRAQLIEDIADVVLMRRLGNVLPPIPAGATITIPAVDSDLNDAEWTSELVEASADTAQPYGQRNLRPYPLGKLVKASTTFLRRNDVAGEAWIRERTARKFSAAEETAFQTGSGSAQPEGYFNSSRPTVVRTANTTSIVPNDVLDVVYGLKSQYKPGSSWILHRTILKTIRQLVINSEVGHYVWMPGMQAGEPSTLAGFPVWESEYAPNTVTADLPIGMFGNHREAYWIVDSLAMTVQRLVERFSGTREIGFQTFKETDGMCVNGNPVVLWKTKA